MAKKKIRIFISSPGDVLQERKIARKVISELNELYSRFVEIEVLMWEDFPLTVDSTFQEGIDFFLKEDVIDFAIFILWSRLGTPLCSKFLKPDGTPYQSGTEYEYDLMWDLYRKKGAPRILTYKKTTEPLLSSRNADELLELIRQKEGVKSFLAEHFHDESTNSNYAYLQFEEETSFETKLRDHLKQLIRRQLGNVGEIREWEGNPYVGLNSFEYEQNTIFFGRRQLVYETTAQLISDENVKRSLIVLGESGSGKSSFVKAGLLPFLCKDNKIDFHTVTPSMFGGKVYSGLIDLLVEKYNFLKDNPFVDELRKGIDENTNFKYLSHSFKNNSHNETIIYIDQFEELFSDTSITEEERLKVILLLKGIVSTRCISIFITMRSDFYNRFSLYGHLAQIKEWAVVVDLPIISHSEISEIIEEPAKKACLKWEIDNKGNALNERIISDAAKINDLPLIEFALSELYNLRDKNDYLTFNAYEEIGGLKGAIVSYADNFYNQLDEKEKVALNEIFGFVIAVWSSHKNTYVRKTSLLKELQRKELNRTVLKKLIEAHILVTGKDHVGQPTVTIVHEILIKYWSVIQAWIKEQKEFLQSNAYYEQRTQHWLNKNKSSKDLVQEKSALLEVEYFIYKYSNLISEDTKEYLLDSLKKERRKGLVKHCFVFLALVLVVLSANLVFLVDLPLDKDLSEGLGLESIKFWDVISMSIIFLVISGQAVLLRCLGKPLYKTIKSTSFIWLFIVLFTYIDASYWFIKDDADGLVFAIPTVFFMIGLSVWIELYRRKLWCKSIFKPYLFSDRFSVLKNLIVYSFISFFVLGLLAIYIGVLNEKNEENEKLLGIADELFDGLNNISNILTPIDRYYINEKRLKYLEEGFINELKDTIREDEEREFQYAVSLYHLAYPEKSLNYLYYSQNWKDHLMVIKNLMLMGEYTLAESALEEYIDGGKYDNFGWLKTDDLIWCAEKLGRFDLAEKLYDIVGSNIPNIVDPAYAINRGHIYWAKGKKDSALVCYEEALALNPQTRVDLARDLHTFSYFDVMEDATLNEIANRMEMKFIPSFTNVDTLTTSLIMEKLYGNWVWKNDLDTTMQVVLSIENNRSFARYHVSNNNGNYNFVSHIRFGKTTKGIIWDEYDPLTDGNSCGILEGINEDSFTLRILENGNPNDKDSRRTYIKMNDF